MKYKYVIGSSLNPYRNLALEQALFKYANGDTVIIYLWQNDNTIVIGRNQDIKAECRADEFLRSGGVIARRKSGGGAVYHDLGNLNYSIICQEAFKEECNYYDLICRLLHQYGLAARYNGRNDIIIDSRKISGNAEYSSKGVICQHGTILIRSDISAMEKFLTPESQKLERNHIESVRSRVANLSKYMPNISVKAVMSDIVSLYDMEMLDILPPEDEVKALEDFFGSRKWIYGGIE